MPLEPFVVQANGTARSLKDGVTVNLGSGRAVEPPPPPGEDPYTPTILGRLPAGTLVTGEILNESSGGADSRLYTDTWWTHEDSGGAYIYALGYAGSGGPEGNVEMKKAFQLTGVDTGSTPQKEDMTFDVLGGRLWVANCGGNTPVNAFAAFRFAEPASLADPGTVTNVAANTFWFKYPGTSAYDCETMMCDPITGRVYFLTKEAVGIAQVFEAPASLVERTPGGSQVNELMAITSGNFTKTGNLTGGDFSPNGNYIYVANNNSRGFKYSVQRNGSNAITGFTFVEEFFIPRPLTPSGTTVSAETLFVRKEGDALIRTSEGGQPQIISLALESTGTPPSNMVVSAIGTSVTNAFDPNIGSVVDTPSGFNISRKHGGGPGNMVIWTHNDSGTASNNPDADLRVIAFDDVEPYGVLHNSLISPGENFDTEDMGWYFDGTTHYMYIGDIGPQGNSDRSGVEIGRREIYRVVEPTVVPNQALVTTGLTPEKYTFAIPTSSIWGTSQQNMEAMIVDPRTGDVFLFQKLINKTNPSSASVWRAPASQFVPGGGEVTFTEVATIPSLVASSIPNGFAAAGISEDGSALFVKNYEEIWIYNRGPNQTVAEALQDNTPLYRQIAGALGGEAADFVPGPEPDRIYMMNEGASTTLRYLTVTWSEA